MANSGNNTGIPAHMRVIGWPKDEDAATPGLIIQNSKNFTFDGVSSYSPASVDGTSEVWFKNSRISDFNGDATNFTALTIASGGKVHGAMR